MTSSMQHDLERGNRLEVDGFGRRGAAGRGSGVRRRPTRGVRDPRAARAGGEGDERALTVRALRATAVEVPMNHVLGTSARRCARRRCFSIDLETEEGVTGRAYLFCYLRGAAPRWRRWSPRSSAWRRASARRRRAVAKLAKRFTLIGVQGIVRMALAGFDVACWDALARAAGKPLVEFLGGTRGRSAPTTATAWAHGHRTRSPTRPTSCSRAAFAA
jgi:L-alanine-DL-glutamate epimerase-like enolase superfamily enzyme